MKKWVCPVCGYVYEGENPPAECPVCHVPGSKFIEQSGDMKLAAEHEYGVYAKTVKNNSDISAEDKAYIPISSRKPQLCLSVITLAANDTQFVGGTLAEVLEGESL